MNLTPKQHLEARLAKRWFYVRLEKCSYANQWDFFLALKGVPIWVEASLLATRSLGIGASLEVEQYEVKGVRSAKIGMWALILFIRLSFAVGLTLPGGTE